MMKRISLGDSQIAGTSNTIFITGSPRSGTTLVGKYIGSLDGVEYHYEPPLLYLLTSMVAAGSIDGGTATDILRLYLYEDLLVESVHGRRVNLRPEDDSLILNTMTWKELNRRWHEIKNREKAINEISAKGLRLAVKMPSIVNAASFLKEGFADSKLVVVLRDGRPVVKSILRKGWMTDESLSREYWPYKLGGSAKTRIPSFVGEADEESWCSMNEVTRACFTWRMDAEATLRVMTDKLFAANLMVIRYEDILNNPRKVVADLSNDLGHPMTDLTEILIKNTAKPSSMTDGPDLESFYGDVEEGELNRFKATNALLGY